MIKKNMKVGEVFEDGGLYYKVLSVNKDGSYSSTRTEEIPEEESTEAKKTVSKK